MARTKDFSFLIGANFTNPKTGRCACSSNSNMGSIVKAMKDALEATGYSELRYYQRKTIEAYL